MKNSSADTACRLCIFFGGVVPWTLIIGSGGLGIAATSPVWDRIAAYMAFGGFALLVLSLALMILFLVGRRASRN